MDELCGGVRYSILDPTGNITALVESAVEVAMQPAIAASIMRRHPEVEQVGFVRLPVSQNTDNHLHGALRMAGGEFCGNATMSAAALCALRAGVGERGIQLAVSMSVSGAKEPVGVLLRRETDGSFAAGVHMPGALGVEPVELAFGEMRGSLPLVRMEGISHLIIEPSSPFFCLRERPEAAEQAVRQWCHALSADGLGLMFLEEGSAARRMTPLVFVPGANTVFWESSCASGSSAVGMCLASREGTPVDLSLAEPGGKLHVKSDPLRAETWLFGSVRLLEECR